MAEKRMISKSISVSEKVNIELPDIFDMLLFTWMIPHADDFGRMPGSPAKIKALVVPMLDKTIKDVETSIQHIHNAGLILWYQVGGEKYIQINNFDDHQTGLHKRTISKFPDPFPEVPGSSGNVQEIPLEQNRTEEKGTERNRTGTEGVSVPTFDNPHNDKIQSLLDQYNVKYNIKQLEDLCSFVGVVDIEVIEDCIKEASDKNVPYALSIVQRLVNEGRTTKELQVLKGGGGNAKPRRDREAVPRKSQFDEELESLFIGTPKRVQG